MYIIFIDEYAGTATYHYQVEQLALVEFVNNFEDDSPPSPMIAPEATTELMRVKMPLALVGQFTKTMNRHRRSLTTPVYGAHQNWSGFG